MELRDFKVVFERSNGTQGNDNFTALNSKEAIDAFKACYRHDTYKIISVETDCRKVTEENA